MLENNWTKQQQKVILKIMLIQIIQLYWYKHDKKTERTPKLNEAATALEIFSNVGLDSA